MAKLILMVGLPFSGKTTRAKALERELGALRLTPDEWHLKLFGQDVYDPCHDSRHSAVEGIMVDLAFQLLHKGISVILDFGFWAVEERVYFRDRARAGGFDFAICYCRCPDGELESRLAQRNSDADAQSFYIPLEKYREYEKIFQVPTGLEGDIIS